MKLKKKNSNVIEAGLYSKYSSIVEDGRIKENAFTQPGKN